MLLVAVVVVAIVASLTHTTPKKEHHSSLFQASEVFLVERSMPTSHLTADILELCNLTPVSARLFLSFFRERFQEGRVLVFGSSASKLSVPESDIDLTLHLPSRIRLIQELKVSKQSRNHPSCGGVTRNIIHALFA